MQDIGDCYQNGQAQIKNKLPSLFFRPRFKRKTKEEKYKKK
ncbi:hypothetical protein TRIPP_31 [Paenibacillus phage Tripp]|uniref:Uncharacterized protein n=1 Tax=Paenibacillus phage Tripp TaxID=1718161 RepID=A0A0N9S7W1_9CAUD|nr:hypothetical protein TRIPP_31 [Paenibacillus phage Tripp]ALH46404.1 hypothetical protein TRIPP_31 [Paenibacillus phage Tripp]